MLLGTRGHSHYVIDSFAENTSKFLYRVLRPRGFTLPEKEGKETSGSVCFTPDGRYIVGGQGERGVAIWDTNKQPDEKKSLLPSWDLVENVRTQASVVAFNHKTNLLATAYKEAVSALAIEGMRWDYGGMMLMIYRCFGCRSNMHRILHRVRSGNELTSNGW